MNRGNRTALVGSLFCLCGSSVLAQATIPSSGQLSNPAPPAISCTTMARGSRTMIATGPTVPFSSVNESTYVETLADGTHITPKPIVTKLYHDAEGRVRSERLFCPQAGEDPNAYVIEIRDPVSGYSYVLDPQNHVAHRYKLEVRQLNLNRGDPSNPKGNGPAASADRATGTKVENEKPVPRTTVEDLGSQTMEGVFVEGKKITTVIPAGAQDNDRDITEVLEEWTAPDLKIPMLVKQSDPRRGESTSRVNTLDRTPPNPSLFQPPLDYRVVDETDIVRITYTRP